MINIQYIIPFMKEGWVAMDKSGEWWWDNDDKAHQIKIFDIAPADDWTKSLIKVGGK